MTVLNYRVAPIVELSHFSCRHGLKRNTGGFMVAIRSGDFQRGLMLATAFAVLVLPTEAEAYTPEGRKACTGDAFRLCSAEIPNVDRVRACLHRNKAQLSPGCRGFISPGAHRPPPGGR